MKVLSNLSGALMDDIDAGIQAAGIDMTAATWQASDAGTLIVGGLPWNGSPVAWFVNLASGAQHQGPGPSATVNVGWVDSRSYDWAYDDGSVYQETSGGLRQLVKLSNTPAQSNWGILDPICGGTFTYITDNGLVTREFTSGANQWQTHVDPAQGGAPRMGIGRRTAQCLQGNCDVIAVDDHGVITRDKSGTGAPQSLWTSRYGYYTIAGNTQSADAAYPISGLVLSGNTALTVSSYDPHVIGFDVNSGKGLFSYPLAVETKFLTKLDNGLTLAVGSDGTLSLLSLSGAP